MPAQRGRPICACRPFARPHAGALIPERLRGPPRLPGVAEEKESARLEAFSDGVFAFAITLLVLDVGVPRFDHVPATRELLHAILEVRHAYFALLLTFATVYVMWMTHHAM